MLASAVFPNGTTGHQLDVLARVPLWRDGLDYKHGTGHGVGCYLNVHEGPHLISYIPRAEDIALQADMTVTIEPGYYEDGAFGIRTENVMVVCVADCAHNFANRGFLCFQPITWVPLQTKLMDLALLTMAEHKWVNDYHERCREVLQPFLSGSDREWMVRATEPLEIVNSK
eukprot:TRINITY_DN2984_c0_g1_i1.p2 TRINITY_DN2984_c0_g1~~TRINITY_DN2984_c0_g1_i1.p2  ORF type:complete len:171 (-),score=30.28 TRINITY_DN2984_c0_g1_i1:1054-1566(-)